MKDIIFDNRNYIVATAFGPLWYNLCVASSGVQIIMEHWRSKSDWTSRVCNAQVFQLIHPSKGSWIDAVGKCNGTEVWPPALVVTSFGPLPEEAVSPFSHWWLSWGFCGSHNRNVIPAKLSFYFEIKDKTDSNNGETTSAIETKTRK